MSYVIGVRLKMMDIFGICPQHHFNPGMTDYFWFYGLSALRNFSKSVQVIISRWCNKNFLTMLLHRFLFCSVPVLQDTFPTQQLHKNVSCWLLSSENWTETGDPTINWALLWFIPDTERKMCERGCWDRQTVGAICRVLITSITLFPPGYYDHEYLVTCSYTGDMKIQVVTAVSCNDRLQWFGLFLCNVIFMTWITR